MHSIIRLSALIGLFVLTAIAAQAQCPGKDAESTVSVFATHVSAAKAVAKDVAAMAKQRDAAKSPEEGARLTEELNKLVAKAKEMMGQIMAEAEQIEAQMKISLEANKHWSEAREKIKSELKRLAKLRGQIEEQMQKTIT